MLKFTVIGSLMAVLLGTAIVDNPTDPPPNQRVVVDVVTVNGSGCPAGTAAVAVSPDNTDFVVTYSNYVASVGIGSIPNDQRKNCQLSIVVHVPQGFSYAVTEFDHTGFVNLAAGATAQFRQNSYFQGQIPTAFQTQRFTGPVSDDWEFDTITDDASLIFSPCGALRNFNINTELRVSAGTSDPRHTTSFLSLDESQHFHVTYRRCSLT